jgi:hypothetical protein
MAPADGRAEDRQDLVQCGDFDPARVLGFGLEPVDERWLFQRLDREAAEVLLQDLDSSGRRVETPNASWSQVTFEVAPIVVSEITTGDHSKCTNGRERPRFGTAQSVVAVPVVNEFALWCAREVNVARECVWDVAIALSIVAISVGPRGS